MSPFNSGFTADCSDYPKTDTDEVKFILINNILVKTLCKSDGWTVIQSRGQFPSFPKDYFSTKTWKEYQVGFGKPGTIEINAQSRSAGKAFERERRMAQILNQKNFA
jgi:hypothetical protein